MMKIRFLAICLSLLSVTFAAQTREARGQKTGGEAIDEKLILCVKSGDANCALRALAAGADVNAEDAKDTTALILAAEGKSAEVVRILLDAGADVNRAQAGEAPPLCRAALLGRKENVEILLEKKARIDVVCDPDHGGTPLMDALLQLTLADMPDGMREDFTPAGGDGDEGVGDDDAKAKSEAGNEAGKSREALKVSRDNYLAITRALLARGADVNVVAKCDVRETALMYAAMGANVEMVKELLGHGADVNRGVPVFMMLLEFERELEQGERLALPAISKEQTSMLEWGEKTRAAREEIKRLLKTAGAQEAKVEGDGGDGEADADALEKAAGATFSDVIEKNDMGDFARLVDAYAAHPLGARALPEALRLAVIYSRDEMVKLLLERGVDPNHGIGTARGYTPLMHAAHDGKFEYVRMLLEAGADVHERNDDGRTALGIAESWTSSSEEHRAIVILLKAHGAASKK